MKKTFVTMVMLVFVCASWGLAAYAAHPLRAAGARGTVSGQIIIKGQGPMIGGMVFFLDEAEGIPPSSTRYWRVPTHAFRLNENSGFSVSLPEGTYFMGAIERASGELLGPPEEGDYFFVSQDSRGNPKRLTVWKNANIDLGILDDAAQFKRGNLASKGITAIEGLIHDIHGNPAEGMIVAAYTNQEMYGKPVFVSERVGKDGRFVLRVDKGGTFYLIARADYTGGPPAPEEFIGFTRESRPVKVKTGKISKGVDITIWPAQMLLE